METTRRNTTYQNRINIIDAIKKFQAVTGIQTTQECYSKLDKYYYFLYAYAERHIKIYLQNYNKKLFLSKRRDVLYIKKFFIKNKFGAYKYKNLANFKEMDDIVFISIIIFDFIFYLEVLKLKSENSTNNKDRYKKLDSINNLLLNFLHLAGNFYSAKIIKDEHLEAILKFLIILSISSKNNEVPNMNDNLTNMMFFVQSIKIVKIVFDKIYKSQNGFNEKQKEILNNIIIFIKDNIIGYSQEKSLNIINKFYLSHNDYYTTSLINLANIIIKMKDDKITKNFVELLTNIYIFDFNYENLMSQLLKLLEPLFLNIDKKYNEEIKREIDLINFIISFIKKLSEREEKILKEEALLKNGFFLGNKVCGISSEIDVLEDDFALIFGFCLYERDNKFKSIKEWTIINIRSKENKNKEKISQIKIWLTKRNNTNDEYNLMISDKNNNYDTNIVIKSKINYIFSFNFIKNKTVKISYINDTSGNINIIKEIKEIKFKFNLDNTYIYIGCDKRNNFEEESNTFFGYIGTIIILNNKKFSKKGDENIDLILQLKGDYASSILMALKDSDSKLIDNDSNFHFRSSTFSNNIMKRLNEIYEASKIKFVEIIKMVISPYSFKLVEYKDEIDYLNRFNNYKYYEELKKSKLEVRQNYLNLKQKTNSSKGEKKIKIFSSVFNSRFNIFENKYSLEEFIKYDGLYYLGLLFEYFYQILSKIEKEKEKEKEKENKKDILIKIGENIIGIIKFFNENLVNSHYLKIFHHHINIFFYQMTVVLKKYISNNINDEILKLIYELIEKITDLTINDGNGNEDEFLKKIIFDIKSKCLGLLHDIFFLLHHDNKSSYFIIYYYISIISKLLNKGKLNDLYSNEFIDEFVDISYIFESKLSFFKNVNENSLNQLLNLYEDFLIKLLKNSAQIWKAKINEEQNNLNSKNKKGKRRDSEEMQKEEKSEKNNPYLFHYMKRVFQKEKNQNTFSKLLNIVYKSDLISDIKPIFIEQMKSILKKNYQKEEKKIIIESCLKILLIYSLVNKEDEEMIHNFLKQLTYYKGFFYTVISSIKQIKFMSEDKLMKSKSLKISESNGQNKQKREDNSKSEEEKDKEKNKVENKFDNNKNIDKEPIAKNENFITDKMGNYKTDINPNEDNKNEKYPLLDLDLNNLNKKQIRTLIKLFQDCISMLFITEPNSKKKVLNEKIENADAKEIYDTLKKNFYAAFKFPEKNIYKDIFSSETQILPELFYFRWKKSNEHDRINLFEDLKNYHDKLLKNHRFPFIFKLILLLDSDKENDSEKNNVKINFIIDICIYIIKQFEKYFEMQLQDKKINKQKKEDFYFISNLINFAVLINKLALKNEKESVYTQNENFNDEIFLKLIVLLQNTGLLYSNYCFQVDENIGKLISEICYDIFIYLLNYDFKKYKEKFINTFIINDKKIKKSYSLFNLMDYNKEEILKKEKKIRKEILNQYLEDSYSNLKNIHDHMFKSDDQKKEVLIFGKKINKIEEVNFTIYFLAKTFIYLNEMKEVFSDELKDFLKSNLILLSMNLYELWTKNIAFYGHKICKKFLLYKETKNLFESHAIQGGNEFEIYEDFFTKDINFKSNGQDKIALCYASRLLDKTEFDFFNDNNKQTEEKNLDDNLKEKLPIFTSFISVPCENRCFLTFDKLEKGNVILNPKNYFLKIKFSGIFKDVFFKDKVFQKIKYTFLSKYRNEKGLETRTKQLEYPSKEKNFSNSLEPKSFLRRDYKFYKNDFFPVSHKYINSTLISDRDDDKLFFYRHKFEEDLKNEINKDFKCELITNQFLYYGIFRFHKDYIYFKSKPDPREKSSKEKENIYSDYIFSIKDDENKTSKEKEILMFVQDIKEIIRKRTLLMKQSLEIFNKNGKSYFFNFFKIKECDEVCKILQNECQCTIEEGSKESIRSKVSLFKKGEITNYEYLLYLNKLSTRTFNDLSQYPIFPWLIKDIGKLIEEDGKKTSDKSVETIDKSKSLGKECENEDEADSNLRNMNYPISMQNPEKRKHEIEKFEEDEKYVKFPNHLGTHYSTSSYIFYYLMRNNPYCQNMIRLQNYKQENPNRMFLSFKDTQKILKTSTDNRELIPDMFCYIDFLININCAYFGIRNGEILVDDFCVYEAFDKDTNANRELISNFVKYLYVHKKLLNDIKTSKGISQWVDIIFGKKQFPEKKEEKIESCNIFNKLTYEQHTNLENKLKNYQKKFEEDKSKDRKNLEKKLLNKIQNKINIINNFGVCPVQLLTETVNYEGNPVSLHQKKVKKNNILKSENYFYFTKTKGIYYSVSENSKDGFDIKKVEFWDNINLKNSKIYICGNFETNLFITNQNNENLKYLYKPNYAISLISLINQFHLPDIFILTCRFFGNYFKVQNNDKEIKIICEDFVTTIVSEDTEENDNGYFYTGLKNGKLIKWVIKILSLDNQNNKNKIKNKSSLFDIEEINHIYDHKKSITAIEINNKKEIIATTGEDKCIHIRKLYDLEILTLIDLTYCYGNKIISRNQNIFPSLIRISDLNCIYVLCYDFDSDNNFIRGYTLNGLFFAQTENDENEKIFYNNIIINKNGNLLVGLHNDNKILKLNSFDLKIRDEKDSSVTNHIGNKWIEFDRPNNAFIILYDNECRFDFINDENKARNIDE